MFCYNMSMKIIQGTRLCAMMLLFCGQAFAEGDGCLHTAREVNEFLERGHGRTNFVLSAQLLNDPTEVAIFVQDETGRTIIANQKEVRGFRRGDMLTIRGFASVNANGETWTQPVEATASGNAPVPEPCDIGLSELNAPENAYLKVRVSGKVFSIAADEFDSSCVVVMLCDDKAVAPVILSRQVYDRYGILPDATIRLTGRYWRSLSGIRKYTGPGIVHDDQTPIETLEPPPDDPFTAPRLERRFYHSPEEISRMGPRTISGRVLAVWNGGNLMVRSAGDRIVNITMMDGIPAPGLGETGVFVGYPYTDLIRINLMRARFRREAVSEDPEDTPEPISAAKLFADNFLTTNGLWQITYHGRLVRLRGTIQSLPMEQSPEQRLYLDSGAHQVPVDISSCRGIAEQLSVGSEIEATGRCLLETESWRADNIFPHVRGFVLVARSADDIRVTKQPPWWTPRRLMMVIGLALAGLVGALIWVSALHRLAERRGQALYRSRQAQNAERHTREIAELRMQDRTRLAVELHDTISQNITGATMQIGTAAQFVKTDAELAIRHINIATRTLDSCREELRNCIWDLRSNTLDEKDLNEAIRRTVQRLVGNARLHIRFNIARDRLSDNTVHALMNIVRELATNAVRHGKATDIRIAGALDGAVLFCSVTDNGCGFDPDDHPGLSEGHFGLQGIEERIDELDGKLSIESRRGEGSRVSFSIRAE